MTKEQTKKVYEDILSIIEYIDCCYIPKNPVQKYNVDKARNNLTKALMKIVRAFNYYNLGEGE